MEYHDVFNDLFPEDKEYQLSNKSEDEINSLIYDENLSESEKAFSYINTKYLFQKISFYNNLTIIFTQEKNQKKIYDIMISKLINEPEEIKISAAKNIIKVLKTIELEKNILFKICELCKEILNQLNCNVYNEWIKVFEEFFNILTMEEIDTTFLDFILNLINYQNSDQFKILGIKLLKIIIIKKKIINNVIFEKIRQLSEDKKVNVRIMMVRDIIPIAFEYINNDLLKDVILDKLKGMVYETNEIIKSFALYNLINVILKINDDKINILLNLFDDLLFNFNEKIIEILTFYINDLIYVISIKIKDHKKNESLTNNFINYYLDTSKNDHPHIKINFILTFPNFIKNNLNYYLNLKNYFISLHDDKHASVRLHWTLNIPKLKDIIDDEELYSVYSVLLYKCINNEDIKESLEHIIKNISIIYDTCFRDIKDKEKKDLFSEIIIILYEKIKDSFNWRLKYDFLNNFFKCFYKETISDLYKQFINIAVFNLNSNISKLIDLTVDLLSDFWYLINEIENRQYLMKILINDFFSSKDWKKRRIFCIISNKFLNILSKITLKGFFYPYIIELLDDKVNIVKEKIYSNISIILIGSNNFEENGLGKKWKEVKKHLSKFSIQTRLGKIVYDEFLKKNDEQFKNNYLKILKENEVKEFQIFKNNEKKSFENIINKSKNDYQNLININFNIFLDKKSNNNNINERKKKIINKKFGTHIIQNYKNKNKKMSLKHYSTSLSKNKKK